MRKRIRLLANLAVVALLAGACLVAWYREPILAAYRLWSVFETLPRRSGDASRFRHRSSGLVFVRVDAGRVDWAESDYDVDAFLITEKELGIEDLAKVLSGGPPPTFAADLAEQDRLGDRLEAEAELSLPSIPELRLAIKSGGIADEDRPIWAKRGSGHVYFLNQVRKRSGPSVVQLYLVHRLAE